MKDLSCRGSLAEGEAHYFTGVMYQSRDRVVNNNLLGTKLIPRCRDDGSFLQETFEDFGGVAFGFDEGPNMFDFAGFADEEGTADDAHEGAAHELFFLPGAELLDGFVSGVAEQWEV
jgi:hypothetical protein